MVATRMWFNERKQQIIFVFSCCLLKWYFQHSSQRGSLPSNSFYLSGQTSVVDDDEANSVIVNLSWKSMWTYCPDLATNTPSLSTCHHLLNKYYWFINKIFLLVLWKLFEWKLFVCVSWNNCVRHHKTGEECWRRSQAQDPILMDVNLYYYQQSTLVLVNIESNGHQPRDYLHQWMKQNKYKYVQIINSFIWYFY